jgi:hypothetical protein
MLRILGERFPKATTGGVLLKHLFAGGKRVFVRLDTCSLQDALAGKGPVGEVQGLWMRLTTSERGIDGVRTMRREDPLRPIYLYLPKPFYRNALNVGTSPPISNTYS